MMRRRVLTELVFAMEIGVTILLGVVIYYMASQALAGRELDRLAQRDGARFLLGGRGASERDHGEDD